jgi:hypothetical protein
MGGIGEWESGRVREAAETKAKRTKNATRQCLKKQANCNCVTDPARSVDKMLIKRSFKNGISRQQVQFFGKNTGMILAWIVVYV